MRSFFQLQIVITFLPFLVTFLLLFVPTAPFAHAKSQPANSRPTSPPTLAADVAYIGDSHSAGCFGTELYQLMKNSSTSSNSTKPANDLKIDLRATCGSSSASWLKPNGNSTSCGFTNCNANGACLQRQKGTAPSLLNLLRNLSLPEKYPRLTVVELGSNMLKSPKSETETEVKQLIQIIKSKRSECVWIGPPQPATHFLSIAEYNKFNNWLKDLVSSQNCRFIDSNNKTKRENLSDPMGLHYKCDDGKAWANKVSQELMPILNSLFSNSRNTAPANGTNQKRETAPPQRPQR